MGKSQLKQSPLIIILTASVSYGTIIILFDELRVLVF